MTIRNGRSYESYINSDSWEKRRGRYFARHKKRCAACGAKDRIHLHHKTYARMGAERDSDLAALCEFCHSALHRWHRELGGSLYEVSEDFIEHSHPNKKRGGEGGETKVTNEPTETGFVPRHLRGAERDSQGRLISTSDWRTEARDLKASFPGRLS